MVESCDITRICAVCEADISGRRSDAKYCSKSCGQKAYVANNQPRVKELRAASYQRNNKRHEGKRKEWYAAIKEKIICAVCHESFSGRRSDAKYCGRSCAKKAYRENNREWVKELKAASYQRNKEHDQAKKKERYQAHKDEISLKGKLARAASNGVALNDRCCIVCGTDISHRILKAQYCEPCYQVREEELNRARANRHYADNRERKKEQAREYGKSPRGRTMRRAWIRRNPSYMRDYQRQKHREKVGYNPDGRTCVDCGTDISHRGHRANFCKPCAEQRRAKLVRTCAVCNVDISLRGRRATFCGRSCRLHCRRQNQRRKYEAQTREWRQNRTCASCRVSIADQSSSAKFCRVCSEQRRKENSLRGVHRRRAMKLEQLGTVSPNITAVLLELQGQRCAAPWCRCRIAKKAPKRGRRIRKFELDHIVPLVLGGLEDDRNFQLLCYPCHRGKGKKMPDVWYVEHGYLGMALSPIVTNGRVSHDPKVDKAAAA